MAALRNAGIKLHRSKANNMFTLDLALNAHTGFSGGTDASKTFVMLNLDTGNTLRIDNTTTQALPRTLKISHEVSKPKAGPAVDRHMVRVDYAVAATETEPACAGYAYVVLGVPRTTTFTAQHVKDVYGFVAAVMLESNAVTKLMSGES